MIDGSLQYHKHPYGGWFVVDLNLRKITIPEIVAFITLTLVILLYQYPSETTSPTGLVIKPSSNIVWTAHTQSFLSRTDNTFVVDLSDYFYATKPLTFIATASAGFQVAIDASILTLTPPPGFIGEINMSIIVSDLESTLTKTIPLVVEPGISQAQIRAHNAPVQLDTKDVEDLEISSEVPVVIIWKSNE